MSYPQAGEEEGKLARIREAIKLLPTPVGLEAGGARISDAPDRQATVRDINLVIRQINNLLSYLDSIILDDINGNVVAPGTLPPTVLDSVAPATVTGFVLSTGLEVDPVDGVYKPFIQADWTANTETDMAAYEINIREDGTTVFDFYFAKHPNTNIKIWSGIKGNVLYEAKIRAIDVFDNRSAFTGLATQTSAQDATAPAVPTTITANGFFQLVVVEWTPPTDADWDLVEIWRSTTNNSATAAKVGEIRGILFIDDGLANATTYFYWLKSRDFSGNVSAFDPGPTSGVSATTLTIQTVDIVDNAITAPKITANAVTAPKIDTAAVTEAKVAAAAITETKIDSNAVTTAKIAANAVTANEIAANTITASEIAASTITATQIAANTITAVEIAANTITASQIAALTITGSEIAAGAITAVKIAANTITANEIAANSINASEINSAVIDSSHLRTDVVVVSVAAQLASAIVTNAKIANAAVNNAKIANLAVTSAKIADLNVTTAKIGSLQVTEAKIGSLAVANSKVASNAVTTAKISNVNVTEGKIADNATTDTGLFTSTSQEGLPDSSFENIGSLNITASGEQIGISARVEFTRTSGSTLQEVRLRLLEGTTVIGQANNLEATFVGTTEGPALEIYVNRVVASGSRTFNIEAQGDSGLNTIRANRRQIAVSDWKK